MLNIEKEREAFEAIPEINDKLHTVYFDETFNNYFAAMVNSSPTVKYVQGAWMAWQEQAKKLEGCVVVPEKHYQVVTLTCAELKEAYDFAAPDETEDQLADLVTIEFSDGHSGAGYYAYMTECEDEGAIKLGDVEAARGGNE